LRCSYCYGSGGTFPHSDQQLTFPEILRLIQSFASLGVSKIRFTGGEPLLRPGIEDLVRQTSALQGISLIGLTTNGLVLEPVLSSLIEAGLNCLNISLDTLARETFQKITGVDGFAQVYSAIIAAEESGAFDRVKINTVVMRGVNDGELRRFALWALNHRIDLRFIEFMPARGSGWGKALFVSEDEIKSRIGLDLREEAIEGNDLGPAVSCSLNGFPGRISFISALTRSFCGRCNRLRLTSNGNLVGCLFRYNSADLKQLLAAGAGTDVIAGHICGIVATPGFRRMPQEHSLAGFNSSMRKIGG
ncbi:MAG: radical SAM protein, partial [Candidatus Zixiibacteriota bacterium]